jgi:hypothetical protein
MSEPTKEKRIIEYGIRESVWKGRPRFFVMVEGHEHERLNYACREFALQKALQFAKLCYHPHLDWTGKTFFDYEFVLTMYKSA